jgi:hypothetical protein
MLRSLTEGHVKEANSDHKNISLHHTKLKEYKEY